MPLLPLLAVTAIASGSIASERESLDFTLKRIRAERVQIVNGRWCGSNVPIPRFARKFASAFARGANLAVKGTPANL